MEWAKDNYVSRGICSQYAIQMNSVKSAVGYIDQYLFFKPSLLLFTVVDFAQNVIKVLSSRNLLKLD